MKTRKSDIIVIFLLILCIALFSKLFFDEFNKQSQVEGAEVVAFIEEKINTVQRQFSDSFKWERLLSESDVYNGDTIRTDADSGVKIVFDDGSELQIGSNTIISITANEDERSIGFVSGNISIQAGGGSSSLSVNTQDGTRLQLDKDGGAYISQSKESLSIGIDKGGASVIKNGVTEILDRASEVIVNVDSQTIEKRLLPIISVSPAHEARFAVASKQSARVQFISELSAGSIPLSNEKDTEHIVLEISPVPDFSKTLMSTAAVIENNMSMVTVDIPVGAWYWRMKNKNNSDVSSIRHFTLYADVPVQPFFPKNNSLITFRQQLPTLQFEWNSASYADGYLFELAYSSDFVNPIKKSTVKNTRFVYESEGTGIFFWRVTPVYTGVQKLDEQSIPVSQFSVVQTNVMQTIESFFPVDNTSYDLQTMKETSIGFSWELKSEAVQYDIAFSSNAGMQDIVMQKSTGQTWVQIAGSELSSVVTAQPLYWAVRWYDVNGNVSPWSDAKSFKGSVGDNSLRLIYPPDGYVVESGFLNALLFSWKSSAAGNRLLQISSEPDFTRIEFEQSVQEESFTGVKVSDGTWYWRVRTVNADNSTASDSASNSFSVCGYLPESKLLTPLSDKTTYLRHEPLLISWQAVDGADYYTVSLFKAEEPSPVLQYAVYDQTQLQADVSPYKNQDWKFTVKALARETEKTSSRNGREAVFYFSTYKIDDILLLSPQQNSVIQGLTALSDGVLIQWNTEELLSSSVLKISSDVSGKNNVYQKRNPSRAERVTSLGEGTWYWSVSGTLKSGEPVSASEVRSFTINKIPLLAKPALIEPVQNAVIDFSYLTKNKKLLFRWTPLKNATHYRIKLVRSVDKKIIFEKILAQTVTYEFSDLPALSRGNFTWEVEALSIGKDNKIEQNGIISTALFAVQLPNIAAPEAKVDGDLYGF